MAFDPFPPRLLAAAATLPDLPEYGFELLPFLRWLTGHMAVRSAAVIEDGRHLDAPVLAAALPPRCAFQRVTTGCVTTLAPGLDILHLAADLPPGELTALLVQVLPHLAPSGLLVMTAPEPAGGAAYAGALRLPIGDGVALIAAGSPPPVFGWMTALPASERDDVAAMFGTLGEQIAKAADLQGRANRQALLAKRERRSTDRLTAKVEALTDETKDLREALTLAEAERAAMEQSTSWKLTGPLRTAMIAAATKLGRYTPPPEPHIYDWKKGFRVEAEKWLWDFLVSGERLVLPSSPAPDISILLVLYNQALLTLVCLQSIADTIPPGLAAEVIIVDNASSDDTGQLLDRLVGARIVRNADNRHFLQGVNQAAELATGRTLLLLNNDAKLHPGALQSALETLDSDPGIGAAGGKILLLDGSLQEAGSIVWQDGTCVGYGRGESPDSPQFQFRHDVDFCSGAFLLIRTELFRALGGLDTAFAPAYYEEVDLCMRLKAAGHRIVYDPRVEIQHFEFGSSASSDAAFELQRRNHGLFTQRHAARLQQGHLPPSAGQLLARMPRDRKRVLYLDDRVPYPELGAGYPRAARILRELVEEGWFVTFYPVYFPEDDWDSIYETFPREVEFMLGYGREHMAAFLAARDGYYDTIIVSRPHNMRDFLKARGESFTPARLIYDAEAIFSTREFLRLKQRGMPANAELRRTMLKEEIGLTQTADMVLTVNTREAEIFRGGGCKRVRVLGLGVDPAPISAGFAARRDFLFVGSLDDDESPNVDALAWFVRDIMPLLDSQLGMPSRLLVAGRARAPRAQALGGGQVEMLGLVDDLTPLYARARVFIAPHRFAGGVPLKVHEAASRGVPVVATELLGQQLGWTDGEELLLASTAAAFAAACVRLHGDPALWHALRRRALDRLAAETQTDDFTATLRAVMAERGAA